MEDIARAQKAGFTAEFRCVDETLIDRFTGRSYERQECVLIEFCRHEGMNDPGDSTILFLVQCSDETRGYISSAYGVYADVDLIEFIMSLEKADSD